MMNYEEIEVLNWLLANEMIYRGRTRLPISPVLRGIKQELEQIDNTKPSEAMKCLEKLGTHRIEYWESLELGSTIPFKSTMEYKIIKQALQQKITKHQIIEDTYYTWEENKEALENKNSKLEKENVAITIENGILKVIIKSLFDRGSPLHQYIDKDFELAIEVDDECSTMILGKHKGVDLDKYLKEVLENE